MRVTLVINALTGGGAQRVLVLLANGLADRGHDVSVVTVLSRSDEAYRLNDNVQRIALHEMPQVQRRNHPLVDNLTLLRRLRQAVWATRPDVVVSFVHMMNIRTILALQGTGVPLMVTEHTDPARSALSVPWRLARRVLYPLAARVVPVSHGVDQGFAWLPPTRRVVIHNPVIAPSPPVARNGGRGHTDAPPTIVAMGRLSHAKGFDLLIDAFAEVAPRHPSWRLTILGEGEERASLEAQAHERKLTDRINLPGFVVDPFSYLTNSDIFVVSSRWEGFCLALGEAMAAGLPAVSFNCPSGPSELIRDGYDGVLVEPENVDELARAIEELMDDEARRKKLGSRARESMQRFDIERVLDQWEAVLNTVLATVSNHVA